jgi:hypothetical protein
MINANAVIPATMRRRRLSAAIVLILTKDPLNLQSELSRIDK